MEDNPVGIPVTAMLSGACGPEGHPPLSPWIMQTDHPIPGSGGMSARLPPKTLEKSKLLFEGKRISRERRTHGVDQTVLPKHLPRNHPSSPRRKEWGRGRWGGTAHLTRTHTTSQTGRNLYLAIVSYISNKITYIWKTYDVQFHPKNLTPART